MNAIISPDGLYRYRLDRDVQPEGLVFAYFGINPSTADASIDDATVRKWKGFTQRKGGKRFIVGNAFAYRATDVFALRHKVDAIGPETGFYLDQIINEADLLIPCWGSANKIPLDMRPMLSVVTSKLRRSGKPVLIFGLTKDGQPKHPLMLPYDTQLAPWHQAP